MATKNQPPPSTARHNLSPAHPTTQPPSQAASPPSKRDLISWWRQFKKNAKKEEEKVEVPTGIFGVPLQVSIRYANVAISLTDGNGKSFIYGYVPIIVAKCGVYLKEKATTVEGIFRLSGSAKRIKDLQTLFDSPDRYGKGLDWSGYTVHDAANILRRYLNQLPEPIIPLEFYNRFRDPLRTHQAQAVGDLEAQSHDSGDFDYDAAIKEYQQLITELPPLNRQLLLYILDLLAVFASKADINRMTAANLAAIFQPGMLSHPQHDMAPPEYRLSQNVLVFLIENQDNFLIGMSGTAADEKTVKEVQSGPATPQPGTPSTPRPGHAKIPVVRSSSNASAGADSVRRFGGVRRNVSVSSRNSKQSATSPSPGSPAYGISGGSGVHRSNTVPSKRSPALASHRFNRQGENAHPERTTSGSPIANAEQPPANAGEQSIEPAVSSERRIQPLSVPLVKEEAATAASIPVVAEKDGPHEQASGYDQQSEFIPPPAVGQQSSSTPVKERGFASIFSKSPSSETERKESRLPNKLRKKRIPGSANPSAHSSTNSLHGNLALSEPVVPAGPLQEVPSHSEEDSHPRDAGLSPPILSNTQPTPPGEDSLQLNDSAVHRSLPVPNESSAQQSSSANLLPAVSPTLSYHSHSSVTDHSDFEQSDDPNSTEAREKRRRWRLSFSPRGEQQHVGSGHSGLQFGSHTGAEHSTSTVGSSSRAKNNTAAENQHPADVSAASPSHAPQSSAENVSSSNVAATASKESEKKGPIDWFRGKLQERKDKEAERERAKSPPPDPSERGSRRSLSAAAAEPAGPRQKSLEDVTEEGQEQSAAPPAFVKPEQA